METSHLRPSCLFVHHRRWLRVIITPFPLIGNLLFVGINRSGKSTVMLNMLIRMAYFAIHHIIYFCCPHVSPEDIEKPEHADYKLIQGFAAAFV